MDDKNILLELANYTEAGEHTKFQLLQNWQEYKFIKKVKYSLLVLTESLQVTANKQLRSYCKDVVVGKQDALKLLSYTYVLKILNFYLEELGITEDMLAEYESYLSAGNWSDFIFSTTRPVDKLWDHRGK